VKTSEWFAQVFRSSIARRWHVRDRSAMGVWYGERRPDPELNKQQPGPSHPDTAT
jgi:hypothetical protein